MEQAREKAYYDLFERMIDQMNDPDHFVRADFVKTLSEICELLHIAKGVTEFYISPSHEKAGDGERLIDYDNGRGEEMILRRRIISKSGSVIIGTLYGAGEDLPFGPVELHRTDILLRALLAFVGRNRLLKAVERFAYFDEQEFPNVRSFFRHLSQLGMQGRIGDHVAAAFNLRHFALINQQLGRELGDVIMSNYVNLMGMAAGADGIVCRLGGDNFVMLFDREAMEEVREILAGVPVVYDEATEQQVMISSTAGLFVIPQGYEMHSPAEIMERIVAALQEARRSSGETIAFYDEQLYEKRERAMRIQNLFPEAMAKGEFRVFYQPKVNVENGQVVGAEALCRWFRDGQIISPGEFIPVLEQSMEICRLDFHMLRLVCRDINRWLSEGKRAVRVSVNLSRKHMADLDLLEHLIKIIDEERTPHEYVEIELTETTTDVGFRDLKRVVSGLQKEGVCTSVDDFGMGYSSLNLIREIPWNVLKIDRCFLPADEEEENSTTSRMYKHVVAMAGDLSLECVTEGVETKKQVEILKNNHCQVAQGFFFDRPLPVEEFEERLDRRYDTPDGKEPERG